MRYVGPEYEHDGAWCERVVVVEFDPDTAVDPPDTAKGIITSYGAYVREAE